MELDSCILVMEILFNLNIQGNEKFKFSLKGPTTLKVWKIKLSALLIMNM